MSDLPASMEGDISKEQKSEEIKIVTLSTQVFQTVVVDIIFRFLNDPQRAALLQASNFLRLRSNLPQSWPTARYFCPSPEAKQPMARLVPQMALMRATLCGKDIGTGSRWAEIMDSKLLQLEQGATLDTYDCDYKTIFQGSTNALTHLDLLYIEPSVDQMMSMSIWAPKLTSLFVMGGRQQMNALANGFGESGPTPLLTSITLLGTCNLDALHMLLKSVPQLTKFLADVWIPGGLNKKESKVRTEICQMISKMKLTHLKVTIDFPASLMLADSVIQSTLESFSCVEEIGGILPHLFKCPNIKEFVCGTGTLTAEQRDQIVAQLPMLEQVSLKRPYDGHIATMWRRLNCLLRSH